MIKETIEIEKRTSNCNTEYGWKISADIVETSCLSDKKKTKEKSHWNWQNDSKRNKYNNKSQMSDVGKERTKSHWLQTKLETNN